MTKEDLKLIHQQLYASCGISLGDTERLIALAQWAIDVKDALEPHSFRSWVKELLSKWPGGKDEL